MGCDIHAMYERRRDKWWFNAGDPEIHRNYTIFAVLADVRNEGLPFISEARLSREQIADWEFDCSDEYHALVKSWGSDGHSHSFVTLAEMKAYDIHQKYYSCRLVIARDDKGAIAGTCADTTRHDLRQVGETEVFGVFGPDQWLALIEYGEHIRAQHELSDEEVRLVFFFDN